MGGMSWFPFAKKSAARVPVVLYTRSDCPLCDEMKAELERAGISHEYELCEVDVNGDPELAERYGWRIPVLAISGQDVFEGRLTAAAFKSRLRTERSR